MNLWTKKKKVPWDEDVGNSLIPAAGISAQGTMFDPIANVMSRQITRRGFLKATAMTGATVLLVSTKTGVLDLPYAEAASQAGTVRFALIADSHTMGARNPRMKSRLGAAVQEVNGLNPRPDWVIYMGDAVHDGSEEQFKYFEEIMSELQVKKVYYVPGEHDWYLDMGNYYMKNMVKGKLPWSFDDKGIHFIGLNGILYPDFWTVRKLTPVQRMDIAGTLNHPMLGPFTLGREQLDWLEKDLSKLGNDAPIVIFIHPPLYHYYRPWNFWTEDAPEAHEILKRFKSVQVLHGHVHQTVQNQIGNINVIGHVSTAWPHPYPATYHSLGLTGQMPRSDPAKVYDGLGWAKYELGEKEIKHEDIVWTLKPPKA